MQVEGGQQEPRSADLVMAMRGPSSRRNLYYVVTPSRGMDASDPIMIGSDEANRVYEFLAG
ncbi:hypothetical protein [Arthrobacter pascens]|uniref:hypothetical protein n=1 Tax=Arthrobacter pascens TaxID=1677 RepID=UPI00196B0380|nr:hypothetical protein [Arthrobacter pascens]MBN3496358.1 hypothetical protein [Arthrobacter pascens]